MAFFKSVASAILNFEILTSDSSTATQKIPIYINSRKFDVLTFFKIFAPTVLNFKILTSDLCSVTQKNPVIFKLKKFPRVLVIFKMLGSLFRVHHFEFWNSNFRFVICVPKYLLISKLKKIQQVLAFLKVLRPPF